MTISNRQRVLEAIKKSLWEQLDQGGDLEINDCDKHDPSHEDADQDGLYVHDVLVEGFIDLNKIAIKIVTELGLDEVGGLTNLTSKVI